jgi:hypothetical protein
MLLYAIKVKGLRRRIADRVEAEQGAAAAGAE